MADTEIVDHRQAAGDPIAETVGRNAGDAKIAQALRRCAGSISRTLDFNRAAKRCSDAREGFDKLRLAITADAGDAVDLAGAHMEARRR